jgi:hypothetical protein
MSNNFSKTVPLVILFAVVGGFFYQKNSPITGKAIGDGTKSNDSYRSY